MDNVLKVIYDKSVNNEILCEKDAYNLLEFLTLEKQLTEYVTNIKFQPLRSNKIASYSAKEKIININLESAYLILSRLNLKNLTKIEISMYRNIFILQILLHELEHANQERLLYLNNNLESFIINLSNCVDFSLQDRLYEFSPNERFAEINSFEDILNMIKQISKKMPDLNNVIQTEFMLRTIKGYHYKDSNITSPLIDFSELGNQKEQLECFDWFENDLRKCYINVSKKYNLANRKFYGFPISREEYAEDMLYILQYMNFYFTDKVKCSSKKYNLQLSNIKNGENKYGSKK